MNEQEIVQLSTALKNVLVDYWVAVVEFLPRMLIAGLVLIAGIALAHMVEQGVKRLASILKLEDLVEPVGADRWGERFGLHVSIGGTLAWLLKWSVLALTLLIIADLLRWTQLTEFLSLVTHYLPTLLISLVILLVGLAGATFVQGIKGVGLVLKWVILIFTLMAALIQLGIAESLINTLFIGIVAMLSLAGGLAFGLGGREHAKKALDHIESKIKSNGN